eukprot:m.51688 g.51688  ORF g.51688 m.51688 type:complete len:286 (+) comp11254_c0_seq1:79-936(+)
MAESEERVVRHETPLEIAPDVLDRVEGEAPARAYLKQKYQKEAKRHWDLFYKRNTVNFFKDRHWLTREFPILLSESTETMGTEPFTPVDGEPSTRPRLLEIGCGVGNTIFPLREENPALFTYACDLSPRAVDFVKQHEQFSDLNNFAFQCDLTQDNILDSMPAHVCDVITAFFVLSALSKEEMPAVIQNIKSVLKIGGTVCFRDYGLYDHAMLRFKPGHKLDEHLYYRQDGTRAYYFTLDEVRDLFESHGFEVMSLTYVTRHTVNKKEGVDVPRVFVQAELKHIE